MSVLFIVRSLAFLLVFSSSLILAQVGGGSGYTLGPLSLTGSTGFSADAYTASGIAGRRPPGSARLFANAAASAFGMSYGIDVLLSTEGNQARQSLSQLGARVSYEWATLAIGDVRPSFSRFSLDGTSVRGGFVELTPGKFLFSFVGGQSQRAVRPDSADPFRPLAYSRSLYGVKVGYGSLSDWFLHLSGMVAKDDPGSLPLLAPLAPQANANVSTIFGARALDSKLSIGGTITYSTMSENTRLSEGDGSSTPSLFRPFLADRPGNKSDYAGQVDVGYTEGNYSVQTSYERIQPGFTSLGLLTARNDEEQFSIRPQFSVWDRRARISLDYTESRNNLLNTLSNTSTRRQVGVNTVTRATDNLMITASYRVLLFDITSRGTGATPAMQQNSQSMTIAPTYTWLSSSIANTASVAASYQLSNMHGGGSTTGSSYNTFTGTALYSASFPSGLTLNSTGTLLFGNAAPTANSSLGFILGAMYPFFERKLQMGTFVGYTHNATVVSSSGGDATTTNNQFSMNVNASCRLWFGDVLRVTARELANSVSTGVRFNELQASVDLTHAL